ncbi:MAG: hypothetical protein ACXVAX_04975 [Pseudobdellovibrio sp.]
MSKNKIIRLHLTFLILAFLLVTSCTKAKFTDVATNASGVSAQGDNSNTVDYNNTTPPPDLGVVQDACNNLTHKTFSQSYFFPKPTYTCKWGVDGNLMPRDRYFQGRIEEEQDLNLEAGAIICGVKFNFVAQKFLYDDHFLMTFDESVIASSYNFESKFNLNYGLLTYNWSNMAGMFWDSHMEGVYCAANASCSFPKTDTQGVINMNFPSLMFQRIMAENVNRTSHAMKFISIGDNDDMDCEHSDVNFSLDVDYVVKK